MSWIGRKKLALVPLHRTNANPPDVIPADWSNQILARVFFAPEPTTGVDLSVRAYFHTVSSGLADLDAVVMPMETVVPNLLQPNVLDEQLGAQLRSQGFD